jgi:uncharacterized membrane protein YphA (DoxX/SURF4 family)
MKPPIIVRLCFAAVWLANGIWCKLLDGVPRHRDIVARILGEEHAQVLTLLIGLGEVAIAVWILSGLHWKWSCAAQILLVATMNLLEFALAPDLLLFGRFNLLVALGYIAIVAWFGFRERTGPA